MAKSWMAKLLFKKGGYGKIMDGKIISKKSYCAGRLFVREYEIKAKKELI